MRCVFNMSLEVLLTFLQTRSQPTFTVDVIYHCIWHIARREYQHCYGLIATKRVKSLAREFMIHCEVSCSNQYTSTVTSHT
jgi:hypothetical protein